MPLDEGENGNESVSRRGALKAIGAGVGIVGFGPAVSAAKRAAEESVDVTPKDCYYEYDCTGEVCQYGGYNEYRRQCCNYGDGYRCDGWEWYGCC